jgi:hypothetical protein
MDNIAVASFFKVCAIFSDVFADASKETPGLQTKSKYIRMRLAIIGAMT